jgi:GxxExxY protein
MSKLDELNRITEAIIGAAIDVHRTLGPGLLESAYQACLAFELMQRGHKVVQQKPLAIIYKDVRLDCGYRLDFDVDDEIIVELKSVEALLPIHEAQLLSYLRLSQRRVGLLINFNVKVLRYGIRRLINGFVQ